MRGAHLRRSRQPLGATSAERSDTHQVHRGRRRQSGSARLSADDWSGQLRVQSGGAGCRARNWQAPLGRARAAADDMSQFRRAANAITAIGAPPPRDTRVGAGELLTLAAKHKRSLQPFAAAYLSSRCSHFAAEHLQCTRALTQHRPSNQTELARKQAPASRAQTALSRGASDWS